MIISYQIIYFVTAWRWKYTSTLNVAWTNMISKDGKNRCHTIVRYFKAGAVHGVFSRRRLSNWKCVSLRGTDVTSRRFHLLRKTRARSAFCPANGKVIKTRRISSASRARLIRRTTPCKAPARLRWSITTAVFSHRKYSTFLLMYSALFGQFFSKTTSYNLNRSSGPNLSVH